MSWVGSQCINYLVRGAGRGSDLDMNFLNVGGVRVKTGVWLIVQRRGEVLEFGI